MASRRGSRRIAALRELIEKDAKGSAVQIAFGYSYRGETNLAFAWLERAYVQCDHGLGMMKGAMQPRNLHGDPRWQPFLKKMGLAV